MVLTRKFSEFDDGGDLSNDKTTVGLGSGGNTKYNNPWTFLPDGTTGDRPTPSADMYFRLRFNTTTRFYEYYNSVTALWVVLEDEASILALLASHLVNEGASLVGLQDQGSIVGKTVQDLANASLIAQTNNGTLANGQFLSVLSTGIVKNTTATGVLSILTGSSLITSIINDDTFATAAVTNIPTALSVKNYIASVIAGSAGGSNGQIQYNNAGAFGGDSITTNGLGAWAGTLSLTGQLNADNLRMDGNTLSSTDTNGNIQLVPNGTGSILSYSGVAFNNIYASSIQSLMPISRARYNTGSGSNTGFFMGFASRASAPGSFSPLIAGDVISRVVAYGDDGTTFEEVGLTQFEISGVVSTGIVPGAYRLYTTNTSGVRTLAFTVSNAQVLTLTNALPVGSGGLGSTATPSNGQIPIGNGTNYVAAAITAGTGVSITNGSGSIVINAIGGGMSWSTTAGTTQAVAVNNGYVSGNAAQSTFTLPATAAVGDRAAVEGLGVGGWILAANTGQTIKIGSSTTSSAGTLASTASSDNVYVVCIVANTTWRVQTTNSAGLTVV